MDNFYKSNLDRNSCRLLVSQIQTAGLAFALMVYSCVLIYGYSVELSGTFDKPAGSPCPFSWFAFAAVKDVPIETFQRILISCILAFVYELIISIILLIGAVKKNVPLCYVWGIFGSLPSIFVGMLILVLLPKQNSMSLPFCFCTFILFQLQSSTIDAARALVKELEDWKTKLSRNCNSAHLADRLLVLAQRQELLMQVLTTRTPAVAA